MLGLSDQQTLKTNEFVTRGPRGATMMHRRLLQCIKITVIILVVSLVILIITAVSKGKGVFDVINFNKISNLPEEILRDGVGNMVFDQFTYSMIFKEPSSGKKSYINISKHKHKFRSGKLKSYIDCVKTEKDTDKQVLCLEFDNINSAVYEQKIDDLDCHVVHWGSNASTSVEHCIDMKENWYGGGALSEQRWPLNRVDVPMQPYISRRFNYLNPDSNKNVHFESFLESYFVSASGTAIILDPFLPLFVSINNKNSHKLCFKSAFEEPYHFDKTSNLLKFTVCRDKTARDIHKLLLKSKLLNRAMSAPNIDIFQKSVWSTRGVDVRNINERALLTYIGNLKHSDLSFSQFFIDGNYSRSSGSVYFDEKRFPHSAQLAMELDSSLPHKKLKIATEVFPLVPKFMSSQHFSYQNSNNVPIPSDGVNRALLLDLSNQKAVDWFTSELENVLKEIKVKGFRFSGGHAATVLNKVGTTLFKYGTKTFYHPNRITHEYGKIAGKFQGNSFLGSGYRNQKYGLVADAGPFRATWTHLKGLKSIIPTVINYGIIGYPFVSVGPIGGISFHLNSSSGHFSLSDRNLFIRWMQLSSFLPIMEFSVGPWQYGGGVLNYTRHLLSYRQNEIWPKYLAPAIKEASGTGYPIIRPLWWIAPLDKTAQFIDCEFMLGDDLLVAPVLEANDLSRQIYLPFGSSWKDQLRKGGVHEGGQWLTNYHVGEFEIAHFVRVTPSDNQ